MSTQEQTLELSFDRADAAYQFVDPAVPASLSVADLTARAAEWLRFPRHDVDGREVSFSLLRGDAEVPKSERVGDALESGDHVVVAREYKNAAGGA